MDVAQKFEEGPEDCNEAAVAIQEALRALQRAPAKPAKATVKEILRRAEEVVAAANYLADAAAKVPKVARSKPSELTPLVSALAPCMVALVSACNSITQVHSDSKAAADATQAVRDVAKNLMELAQASRTAKCDPQAELTMTTSMSDVRRGVRVLISLMEKATPGMDMLDEAVRVVGEALRSGVEVKTEDAVGGLTGLEVASEELAAAMKRVLSTAAEDSAGLGPVTQDAAQAAVAFVAASQNYDNVTRAVAIVKRAEALADKIRSAPNADDCTAHAKAINSSVVALLAEMKEVSANERSAAVKDAIKQKYVAVKAAQPQLVEAGKALRSKEGTQAAVADAADALVAAMREMAFASPEAPKSEQLIDAGRAVASATKSAVQTSISVAKRPDDGFVQGQLLMASQDVDLARAETAAVARSMAPGRAEMEDARKRIAKQVGEMEAAGIAAEIGLLNVATVKSRTAAQDSLLAAAEEMKQSISLMLEAAKAKDLRELGARASPVAVGVDLTASNARELAGTTGDEHFQVASLSSAKGTGEAALHFLDAALELSADPTNKAAQKSLLGANAEADERVSALKLALKTSAEALARCDEAAANIQAEAQRLQHGSDAAEALSYAAAQAAVISVARVLGKAVQKVQRGAKGNAPEIGDFCLDLSACCTPFVDAVLNASQAVGHGELQDRLMAEAAQTCQSLARLCQVSRSIAADPNEKHLTELSLAFKGCTDALGATVRGIRDAAVGEKECRDAAVAISKAQADLDGAVIFAETGHLQFGDGLPLAEVSAEFEKTARAVLAAGKQLVASADKQAELGEAAKQLASSVEQLADRCKAVATCIGDYVEFSAQKSLLLGTKSAAMRAQAVVVAARNAADEDQLNALLKALSSELGSLVKSVKQTTSAAVETQEAIGRARAAIEASVEGYASLKGDKVEAKDVAAALSEVTQVANGVVSAAGKNSAKDLLAVLNESQSAVTSFLAKCKGAERLTKDGEVQAKLAEAATGMAHCIVDLLDAVNTRRKDNWEDAEAIAAFSDTLTDRGAAVVGALKLLPGSKALELEESTLGAEVLDTLKVAIAAVQKEAEKLSAGGKKSDIGGILANASNALLSAMVVLFKTAGQAQQELIARGKTNARLDVYRKDPQWAQGLMTTVSEVVSASSFLVACTSRCGAVDTQGLEAAVEDLSKAAKNVSSGASRVVAASKAKSDSRSAALTKVNQAPPPASGGK
jgi:hypothetical protein